MIIKSVHVWRFTKARRGTGRMICQIVIRFSTNTVIKLNKKSVPREMFIKLANGAGS